MNCPKSTKNLAFRNEYWVSNDKKVPTVSTSDLRSLFKEIADNDNRERKMHISGQESHELLKKSIIDLANEAACGFINDIIKEASSRKIGSVDVDIINKVMEDRKK